MTVVVFMIILWYSGLFFQTFFLHRYSAHQTFTMSKFGEKACFFLTWLTQGSNYLSAYGYGVMHRLHHAYADTEKDPHSPKYDENLFKMMWRTKNIYQDINNNRIAIEDKFTKNVPQWKSFDNFASSKLSRLAWGALYVVFFCFFCYCLVAMVVFTSCFFNGANTRCNN
jgi:stearoyl-CoA desaturase (delta-9 desaturase)